MILSATVRQSVIVITEHFGLLRSQWHWSHIWEFKCHWSNLFKAVGLDQQSHVCVACGSGTDLTSWISVCFVGRALVRFTLEPTFNTTGHIFDSTSNAGFGRRGTSHTLLWGHKILAFNQAFGRRLSRLFGFFHATHTENIFYFVGVNFFAIIYGPMHFRIFGFFAG